MVARTRPDCVLLDLRPPTPSGIECVAAIRAARPAARLLVVSDADGFDVIADAFAAGADAYVVRDARTHDRLGDLVRRLAEGTIVAPSASNGVDLIDRFAAAGS